MRPGWFLSLATLVLAAGVFADAQAPKVVSLIVTGGTVVTVDGARTVIPRGAVAIDGTRIAGVGTAADIARGSLSLIHI